MSKIEDIRGIMSDDRLTESRIEIFGRNSIVIEGCYGIKEYSADVIQINMPKGTLIVVGIGLEIKNMSDRCITIHGKIVTIEFEGA